MSTTHRVCPEQGFTLIEVMIAISILAIGVLAVVGLQYRIVNGNTNGNVVTQELALAQRIMEQQKIVAEAKTLKPSTLTNVDDQGKAGGPYSVKVSVTNPMGGSLSRFIIVTVTRKGGIGGHSVTLRSLTQGNGI